MPIEITTAISSTLIHPPPDAVNHNKKTPHVSSLAFSVLIIQSLFSIPALALPLSTSDSLTFSTTDQSIWGAGASPTVSADFTARLINIDTGPTSIGGMIRCPPQFPIPLIWDGKWLTMVAASFTPQAPVSMAVAST
jgi:hypothetical protein